MANSLAFIKKLIISKSIFVTDNVSIVTKRKWEQGETRPTGPALKLLNVLADKGLQAII
jgi:putative transcriptional regulator